VRPRLEHFDSDRELPLDAVVEECEEEVVLAREVRIDRALVKPAVLATSSSVEPWNPSRRRRSRRRRAGAFGSSPAGARRERFERPLAGRSDVIADLLVIPVGPCDTRRYDGYGLASHLPKSSSQ